MNVALGAEGADRAPDPWKVLTSTGMAVFAVFLDTTILFVAFSAIGRSYPNVTTGALSWILNAYTIAFAAFLIPAGRLADRVGRVQIVNLKLLYGRPSPGRPTFEDDRTAH